MDNLTHTLTGALLAQTGLRERTPYATTALVVGANLPDLDIVSRLFGGKMAYLEFHRGVSHSLLAIIVLGAFLTGVIWAGNRLRRQEKRQTIPLRQLLLVSLVGVASHPILDFTNSYGIRPFLPFSEQWVYGDLVFIADPLLWLLLGGSLFLLTSRTRGQWIAWISLGAILTVLVLGVPIEATGLRAVWMVALALLALSRRYLHPAPRGLAVAALAGMVLYWGFRGVAHAIALDHLKRYVQEELVEEENVRMAALPMPTSPFIWRGLIETETELFITERLHILGNTGNPRLQRRSRSLDDLLVRAALETPQGAVMRSFARFLITRVSVQGDQVQVILSDARFAQGDDMGWCALTVDLPATRRYPRPDQQPQQTVEGMSSNPGNRK